MLSLRFLAVRDVHHPTAVVRDGLPSGRATWSIQTQGGPSTRFIDLDTGKGQDNVVQQRIKQEDHHTPAAQAATATSPLWPEQVEVQDRADQDTVEVALMFEVAQTPTEKRKRFCHSIATIDLLELRHKPDETVNLWRPLGPVGASPIKSENGNGHDFGAIQIAVTYYSDDCVDEGYMYALFCGLVPLPLILLWKNSTKRPLPPADTFLKNNWRENNTPSGSTTGTITTTSNNNSNHNNEKDKGNEEKNNSS